MKGTRCCAPATEGSRGQVLTDRIPVAADSMQVKR
jgi:hypothetical protein